MGAEALIVAHPFTPRRLRRGSSGSKLRIEGPRVCDRFFLLHCAVFWPVVPWHSVTVAGEWAAAVFAAVAWAAECAVAVWVAAVSAVAMPAVASTVGTLPADSEA